MIDRPMIFSAPMVLATLAWERNDWVAAYSYTTERRNIDA